MEVFWRNKNELIKLRDEFEKSKDPYTDYIDNYSQYEQAEKWNLVLSNRIKFINDLIKEIEELAKKTRINVNNFQYKQGYIRVKYNDEYKYRRCESKLKK